MFNLIPEQKIAKNRNKSQKIAINRKKSQKIDYIDCDFFPNEKIDLNGSILSSNLSKKQIELDAVYNDELQSELCSNLRSRSLRLKKPEAVSHGKNMLADATQPTEGCWNEEPTPRDDSLLIANPPNYMRR